MVTNKTIQKTQKIPSNVLQISEYSGRVPVKIPSVFTSEPFSSITKVLARQSFLAASPIATKETFKSKHFKSLSFLKVTKPPAEIRATSVLYSPE